jgi:anti-sigma B factor antagonist
MHKSLRAPLIAASGPYASQVAAMGKARAVDEVTGAAHGDQQRTVPLELSHRISPAGEVIVDLGGELDIASAEVAVSYVRDVIDRHRRPMIVDLTALAFCDARGLAALVRMAGYAEQMGCMFQLSSPSLSLVKIMRITGLDRRFLAFQVPEQAASLRLA